MNKVNIKNMIYLAIRIIIPIILVLLSFRYRSLIYFPDINLMDEGYIASTVRRILQGEIIYRDFHLPYPPGLYYFYIWLIKLTGANIFILVRLLQVILISIFAVIVYYIAARLMPRFLAFFLGLHVLFVGGIGYNYHYATTSSFGVFLAFISLLLILKFYELNKRYMLFLSGIFLSLTFIFYHQWSIFVFFSILVHMIFQRYLCYKNYSYILKSSWRDIFINISVLLLSFLIIIVPLVIYFSFHLALKELFIDLFIWPISAADVSKIAAYPKIDYSGYMHFLQKNSLYLPGIIILSMSIFLFYRLKIRKFNKEDNNALLFLILSLISYIYFHNTPAESHWYVIITPINITGAYIIYRTASYLYRDIKDSINIRIKKAILIVFIIPFIVYYFNSPSANKWSMYSDDIYSGLKYLYKNLNNHDTILRIFLKERTKNPKDYFSCYAYDVAEYIMDHTDPSDRIYVFPTNPGLYYLADRNNATKNDYIFIGTLGMGREKEEIDCLRYWGPKYVILSPSIFTIPIWYHYKDLAKYISKNYYVIDNIAGYPILAKRDVPLETDFIYDLSLK